jgi:tetratricopeptide (TPR) repeat protein
MRRNRKVAVLVLACGVVAVATWWPSASRWWRDYRRASTAKECRAARDRRQWDDLHSLAERWSQWDPKNANPWLFLAEAAQGHNDTAATARYLEAIPDTDPKVLAALVELIKLEFGPLNRPAKGVAACERLLRLEPRATSAHRQLINFYALSLQRAKLLQHIAAAIRAEREPPEAYVFLLLVDTLRLGNAVEANERWLQSDPEAEVFQVARVLHMPELHESVGNVIGETTDVGRQPPRTSPRSKSELVDELLDHFPHNLELLAYKAEACVRDGDQDCVIQLLSQAPAEAEEDSRFWRFKGWLHEFRQEMPDAEVAYRRALELRPLDWNVLARLAGLERLRGNTQEVARLNKLVNAANDIRREMRKLPGPDGVTREILSDMAAYARGCKDTEVAAALERRVEGLGNR